MWGLSVSPLLPCVLWSMQLKAVPQKHWSQSNPSVAHLKDSLSEEGPGEGVGVAGFAGAGISFKNDHSFVGSAAGRLRSSSCCISFNAASVLDALSRESSRNLIAACPAKYRCSHSLEVISFAARVFRFFPSLGLFPDAYENVSLSFPSTHIPHQSRDDWEPLNTTTMCLFCLGIHS